MLKHFLICSIAALAISCETSGKPGDPAPNHQEIQTKPSGDLYNPKTDLAKVQSAWHQEAANQAYVPLNIGKWGLGNFGNYSGGVVYFYEAAERWGDFANTARGMPITIDNRTYPTNENYYQASKFDVTDPNFTWAQTYGQAPGQSYAKFPPAVRSRLTNGPVPSFDAKKTMWKSMVAKFKQNPSVRWKLIATHQAIIVENTKRLNELYKVLKIDNIWGAGLDGNGENRLGIFLMVMRQQLQTVGNISDNMPNWLNWKLDQMTVADIINQITK